MKWTRVCQPRLKGGLGVRDIRLVNLSLLAKWRWRLISDNGSLWKNVLQDKYGDGLVALGFLSEGLRSRIASNWWKDLMMLVVDGGESWFVTEVVRKLGDEMNTSFWNDKWHSDGVLRNLYPRLFALSTQKNFMVGELGIRTGEGRGWEFTWRRPLFEWEGDSLQNLLSVLEGVRLGGGSDVWVWRLGEEGVFTVNSCYKLLEGLWLSDGELSGLETFDVDKVFG